MLIHGWAMNSAIWRDWLVALTQSYRVFCVELPGHGESEYTQHWMMDELLEALAKQLPATANVLGWSLGGMVALAFADKYPQRIEKLILLASSAKFTQSDDWVFAVEKDTLKMFAAGLVDNASATIKRFLLLQTHGIAEPKKMNGCLKHSVSVPSDIKGLESGLYILQNTDLRKALQQIACPVLMILGKKDALIPVGVGAELLNINPTIKLRLIEQATHVPFLSHQNEVAQVLNDFVLDKECVS
ncbi:MAG: pimeloyl-[acyl-carrier protein] methyl ester esterase [Cycloclasticus sp.]|nr:MAG: pimeloyl-[acyl-carrier protein] methyl ester esterase [Cycloclasticus sp.]